jgi:uracil-DNA glycosylase
MLQIPEGWRDALADELQKPYIPALEAFVEEERAHHTVFPPPEDVFAALEATPYDKVKVLILGQDPYHGEGQAHGLSFSVRPGVKPPPSLVNIYKELRDDLGVPIPKHGYLKHWAEQGILLLNTVLTVRANEAFSHRKQGWEKFTDAIIRKVSEKSEPVVFVLWGAPAQKKIELIDTSRHTVIQSAHPSPLSAKSGFFGSKPFSKVNDALSAAGKSPIDWKLPEL